MSFLKDKRVIVCAGSGGVGKTTLSASLGAHIAQSGQRVLVLTIDPAKRLATSLGIKQLTDDKVVKAPLSDAKGELYAGIIQPQSAFETFIRENSPDNRVVEKLFQNSLYKQLSTAFAGTQEFTSLNAVLLAAESNKYDLVILDTPPTQHAIDFLQAPEKLYALFQKSITQWFVGANNNGGGWIKRAMSKGTRTVFKALELVTGSGFVTELSDFFESVQTLEAKISERSRKTSELLKSESTSFFLITGFDESKIAEAEYFYSHLERGGHHLGAVIVNRALPQWAESSEEVQVPEDVQNQYEILQEYYQDFKKYYAQRQKYYDAFKQRLQGRVPVVKIPDMNQDIFGLDSLVRLGEEVVNRFES